MRKARTREKYSGNLAIFLPNAYCTVYVESVKSNRIITTAITEHDNKATMLTSQIFEVELACP